MGVDAGYTTRIWMRWVEMYELFHAEWMLGVFQIGGGEIGG